MDWGGTTKMVKGLKDKIYEEMTWSVQLREGWGMSPWPSRAPSWGPAAGKVLMSFWWPAIGHENGINLCQGKVRLDMRKRFFTEGVFSPWNRLPGKWSQYQTCQSSRSIWKMLLVTWFNFRCSVRSRDLDLIILVSPFQLEMFYDSVFYLTEVSYVRQWEGFVWTSAALFRNWTLKLLASILKGYLSDQELTSLNLDMKEFPILKTALVLCHPFSRNAFSMCFNNVGKG